MAALISPGIHLSGELMETTLSQAVAALNHGEVIAYPTEAVWGVGCDPNNESAVQRLLALKQRPVEKGVILIAASIDQFEPYLSLISSAQREQLEQTWPGFQTWVVPVTDDVPYWLRGIHSSIALRVSAHTVVRDLCHRFGGALVSTSANLAGQPEAKTVQDVQHYFGDRLGCIVAGDLGGEDKPSPITDLQTGRSLR